MMRISAPGATPSTGPNGISRARVSRKPTTSAGRGGCAAPLDLGPGADGQARQAAARLDQQAVDAPPPVPETTSGSIASTAATRLRMALTNAATWLISDELKGTYPSIMSCTFAARSPMTKGLVRTSMPGASRPLPTAAFSA